MGTYVPQNRVRELLAMSGEHSDNGVTSIDADESVRNVSRRCAVFWFGEGEFGKARFLKATGSTDTTQADRWFDEGVVQVRQDVIKAIQTNLFPWFDKEYMKAENPESLLPSGWRHDQKTGVWLAESDAAASGTAPKPYHDLLDRAWQHAHGRKILRATLTFVDELGDNPGLPTYAGTK